VYDYMDNGSLDGWLHSAGKTIPTMTRALSGRREAGLDWPTRIRVAVGAAQGLCYMHHECTPPIVHRDVKTSNILLDSEFRAKIADFGLARMLVQAGTPNTMSAVAGSFGYMAPGKESSTNLLWPGFYWALSDDACVQSAVTRGR
jgi:serine/threonine protein kinase